MKLINKIAYAAEECWSYPEYMLDIYYNNIIFRAERCRYQSSLRYIICYL